MEAHQVNKHINIEAHQVNKHVNMEAHQVNKHGGTSGKLTWRHIR